MGKALATVGAGLGALRRGLAGALLPPVCPLTGERVLVPGTLAPSIWSELTFVTRPMCDVSGLPFERDPGPGAISAAVAARPPAYDRARAALVYAGPARRLVHQLKYSDRMDLTPLMARWLVTAGAELLAGADMLAPVPLHRRRLLRRRFNQAAALAAAVGDLSGIRPVPDLLERVRPTPSQVGLSRAGRRRNVRGAFRVTGRMPVAGRHIVLIDDVMTSGATAEACAAVLRRAGARRIDVLTVARVVAPQDTTI